MKPEANLNHGSDLLPEHGSNAYFEDRGIELSEVLAALFAQWRRLLTIPLVAGVCAFGATYLIKPTFTARTVFLPPQQQQSAAASALAALGPLSGLIGGSGALRTPGDQYVALMESVNVQDRIIDQFQLMQLYDAKFRFDARKELASNVRIGLGKKDGLITVEVSDHDAKRAAEMANAHVAELHRIAGQLTLTEAQQRRKFFEGQMSATKERLTQAQIALQGSGFSPGALKAEPKAAADEYAKLRAALTAADVKLQALRGVLVGNAPELLQQQAVVGALRAELARVEQRGADASFSGDSDYISKYREYRYQETLFDLFARQYEMARLDEAREGTLIQVVDIATPPEVKSKPKRTSIALSTVLLTGFALSFWIIFWKRKPRPV